MGIRTMIFKEYINQNIPVWSVIKQDHAICRNIDDYIKPEKLLFKPDFKNPFENGLRESILKNTADRNWLWDRLCNPYPSFYLAEIEKSDWKKARTVWKDNPKLIDIVGDYAWSMKNRSRTILDEPYEEDKRYRKLCQRDLDKVLELKTESMIPFTELTSPDSRMDFHRTIWCKNLSTNKLTIVDGTHRNIALAWRYIEEAEEYSFPIHAIVFEVNQ